MTTTKLARRIDPLPFWLIGCSGAFALLLLSPFILFWIHDSFLRIASISAWNETGKPVSLVLTFDEEPERTARFDVVEPTAWRQDLYRQRSAMTLRSVQVLQDGRERTTVIGEHITTGWDLRLSIKSDLSVGSDIDMDANM